MLITVNSHCIDLSITLVSHVCILQTMHVCICYKAFGLNDWTLHMQF